MKRKPPTVTIIVKPEIGSSKDARILWRDAVTRALEMPIIIEDFPFQIDLVGYQTGTDIIVVEVIPQKQKKGTIDLHAIMNIRFTDAIEPETVIDMREPVIPQVFVGGKLDCIRHAIRINEEIIKFIESVGTEHIQQLIEKRSAVLN